MKQQFVIDIEVYTRKEDRLFGTRASVTCAETMTGTELAVSPEGCATPSEAITAMGLWLNAKLSQYILHIGDAMRKEAAKQIRIATDLPREDRD